MDYNTINDSMQEEIGDIKACIEKYLESDIALIEKVSIHHRCAIKKN